MKKRILALALAVVMLFALSACSMKKEAAPAPTEQPATPTPAPAAPAPTPKPTEKPAETPAPAEAPAPSGIPDGSGTVTFTSKTQNFSISFDSDKYTAFELPTGGIRVNAGQEEGIPCCTVTLAEKELMGQENAADATSYLLSMAQGVQTELGDILTAGPDKLDSPIEGRDLIGLYYTYTDEETGSTVWNLYYAEDLDNGKIAVFSANAFEDDVEAVKGILVVAIESFKLA